MSAAFPEWRPESPYKINTIGELNPLVLGDIRAFLEQDPPRIPIKQITGFTQFAANSASVTTQENTSSTVYGALATTGPLLDKLAPGSYVLLYGAMCTLITGTGGNGYCAPSINGATPATGTDCIIGVFSNTAQSSSAMAISTNLTGDGNTVELLYKIASVTTLSFGNRWLVALRYA